MDLTSATVIDCSAMIVKLVTKARPLYSTLPELTMRRLTSISIAVACALGVTAVAAQTVQRDGKDVRPAQTRAPAQTAQAPAGGAATGGAAAGGAAAGTATIGVGTAALIAVGVVAVAAAAGGSDSDTAVSHSAVTHNP